jgi:hypothetical protein
MAVNAKLNRETLEASFAQIEYLKGIKKDQMAGLCKMFDGIYYFLRLNSLLGYKYVNVNAKSN